MVDTPEVKITTACLPYSMARMDRKNPQGYKTFFIMRANGGKRWSREA
jgi:hypothetical protein